jgi:hypothetical protein
MSLAVCTSRVPSVRLLVNRGTAPRLLEGVTCFLVDSSLCSLCSAPLLNTDAPSVIVIGGGLKEEADAWDAWDGEEGTMRGARFLGEEGMDPRDPMLRGM